MIRASTDFGLQAGLFQVSNQSAELLFGRLIVCQERQYST